MADVYVSFRCSACGKFSEPFKVNGSWMPKRDFLEVMKSRGWRITRSHIALCKECNIDMISHNRSLEEEIVEKKKESVKKK